MDKYYTILSFSHNSKFVDKSIGNYTYFFMGYRGIQTNAGPKHSGKSLGLRFILKSNK